MTSTPSQSSGAATLDASTPGASARLLQMAHGYAVTQMVAVAARLELADLLAAGPRTVTALAQATGIRPDALARFLRGAVAVGLLTEPKRDWFALTPVGDGLRSSNPICLRDLAIAQASPGLYRAWEGLFDALHSGETAISHVHGQSSWEYFAQHPQEGARFAAAMGNLSATVAAAAVPRYDASRFTRIVDVGGSEGVLLAGLLDAAPQATGILFDRPEVIDRARQTITNRGLAERVELIAGDFFTDIPADGDLYLLKAVLHDWDDEHATRILTNCHRAARPGSTLLIVEGVLPEDPEHNPAPELRIIDLMMLVMEGGKERTRTEYETLLNTAGYQLTQSSPPPATGTFSKPAGGADTGGLPEFGDRSVR